MYGIYLSVGGVIRLIIADKIIRVIDNNINKNKNKSKAIIKGKMNNILNKIIIYLRNTIIMTTTVQIIITRNTCI